MAALAHISVRQFIYSRKILLTQQDKVKVFILGTFSQNPTLYCGKLGNNRLVYLSLSLVFISFNIRWALDLDIPVICSICFNVLP